MPAGAFSATGWPEEGAIVSVRAAGSMACILPATAKVPASGMTLVIVGFEVAWARTGPAPAKLTVARVATTAATAAVPSRADRSVIGCPPPYAPSPAHNAPGWARHRLWPVQPPGDRGRGVSACSRGCRVKIPEARGKRYVGARAAVGAGRISCRRSPAGAAVPAGRGKSLRHLGLSPLPPRPTAA